MSRLSRYEDFRWVGDRTTQRVYNQDVLDDEERALLQAAMGRNDLTAFSPDTLAEARNRGYRLAKA